MPSFNKAILIGNVTRDIESIITQGDLTIANFAMAVNENYKKDGEKVQETSFIDCKVFGKQAETMIEYVKKGDCILVEGKLKQERWETDGQKRSKIVVNILGFTFMPKNSNQQQDNKPYKVDTSGAVDLNPPVDNGVPF